MAVATGAHDKGDKRDLTKIVNDFSNPAHNLEALYKANKDIKNYARMVMVKASEEAKTYSKEDIKDTLEIADDRIKELEDLEQEKTKAFDKNIIPKEYLELKDVIASIEELIKTRELLIELEVYKAVLQGKSESDIISIIDARVSKYNTSMEVMITHLASLIVKGIDKAIKEFGLKSYTKEELYEAMRQFEFDAENSVYKDLDEEFKEKLRTQIHEEKLKYPQIMSLSVAEPEDEKIQDEAKNTSTQDDSSTTGPESTSKEAEGETTDTGKIPKIIREAPKLTWKTALSIATGIGLGVGVFFTFNAAGVAVLSIAGMIGKLVLNNKRKKLIEKRLLGQVEIQSTEEPSKGLKGAIEKFRKYVNSEEGIRDLSALLSASIITGNLLNLASLLAGPELPPPPLEDGSTVVIGDGVGTHNISTGYDSAALSVTRNGAETLIPQYINPTDSMFKEFAIMDPTGQTVLQRISTTGLSAAEASQQFGVPLEQIAVNVGRAADGVDQAWISVNELIGKTGRIM